MNELEKALEDFDIKHYFGNITMEDFFAINLLEG